LKRVPGHDDDLLAAVKQIRGINLRVAARADVDASLVSRVINGERKSPTIMAALRTELKLIRDALDEAIVDG